MCTLYNMEVRDSPRVDNSSDDDDDMPLGNWVYTMGGSVVMTWLL